jgi:bifunctional non-homologous end joining protein LigD
MAFFTGIFPSDSFRDTNDLNWLLLRIQSQPTTQPYVQCAMLPRIQPMRLTKIAKAFDDPDYIFELKHDGFRAIAYIENGECKLASRNSNQFKSFVSLKESLGKIPVKNAILDGEVVCLDEHGVSRFNQLLSRKGKPVFYAFDLLSLNGDDLRSLPLIERKRRLHEVVQRSRFHAIIYAQHIEDQGIGLFEEICSKDLEGIVAKRKLGIYKNNGLGWKKIKNPKYSQAEGRHDLFTRVKK